jgi:hypothetical protein
LRSLPPLAGRGGIKGGEPDFDNTKMEKIRSFFRPLSNRLKIMMERSALGSAGIAL